MGRRRVCRWDGHDSGRARWSLRLPNGSGGDSAVSTSSLGAVPWGLGFLQGCDSPCTHHQTRDRVRHIGCLTRSNVLSGRKLSSGSAPGQPRIFELGQFRVAGRVARGSLDAGPLPFIAMARWVASQSRRRQLAPRPRVGRRTLIVMSPRERLNRSFVGGVAHGETEMPRLVLTWRTRKEPNQQQVAGVALIARCFDNMGT